MTRKARIGRKSRGPILCALLAVFLFAAPQVAQAGVTLEVGTGKTYATIQAAVNAAAAGDTINVAAGTYDENVVISHKNNITIRGVGDTTLVEGDGIGFRIHTSSGITIEDLKIHTVGDANHGINVDGEALDGDVSNNLTVRNTTIVTEATGIIGDSVAAGVHSGWLITGNRITGASGGIGLQDVTNSTISNNTITIADGTNIYWTSERYNLTDLVIEHNTVSGSGGSQVSVMTDWNESGTRVPFESPVVDTTITGVTFHGNTFADWGSRAIRVGDGSGGSATGTVMGIVIDGNTFQMTENLEVIGGTDQLTATGGLNIFNVTYPATIQKARDSAFLTDTINVVAPVISASPSPVGVLKGTLLAAAPTAAPAGAPVVHVTLTNNSGVARTVKVQVVADAAAKAHVQAWLLDSTGTWYNSIVDGFGPANGFSVPDGYTGTNDFYVMGDKAGTYSATLNLVDATTGELLATTSITAVVGEFVLSASPSPVGVLKGTLLAAAPTAAPAGAPVVHVTLTNNSGFARTVKVEVVADAAAKAHIQAWLLDSTGTWYNSIVDGFGPANGFSVPDGYTGTNDFYVMGDQVGTYSATLNLRDAGTGELLATTSITAVVAAATYTLTYTAGANGTITGTSPQTVNSGGSGTLVTATPNAGYHFVSWSDGVLTAARTNSNVTGDMTVSATFAINTYTLTYTAGANGTISGTSPQTVNSGGSGTPVLAVPAAGYHFVSWSDGVLTAARTNSNVTGDITVTATFAITPVTYTLTYTAGANGTISGTSPQTVNSGGSGTPVLAVPAAGYHFVSWSDGFSTATRTDTNVTANHTISATFAVNATSLTIRTTRTSAYIGQTFILSGLARPTPGMIGQNMEVYVKKPGKSYWTYSSRRTIYVGPSGTAEWWYRYYLDPNKVASGLVRRGTYLFKAVYNGDATYAASQSTIISVLVR